MGKKKKKSLAAKCEDTGCRREHVEYKGDWVLDALFSDESETFRAPAAVSTGQWVTVRLRAEKELAISASLLVGSQPSRIAMTKTRTDNLFSWYEAQFTCGLEAIPYRILVEGIGRDIVIQKDGAHWADRPSQTDRDFKVIPGFKTPSWAHGAVQYQIFPDRFANGNSANDVVNRELYQLRPDALVHGGNNSDDRNGKTIPAMTSRMSTGRDNAVVDREYSYDGSYVRKITRWDALPASDDFRCFYGGDLQGIAEKLDYIQSLGVEAIYLNPIFVSPSSHKYDTQDYWHVDPHLAVVCDDADQPLPPGDHDNENALQYVRRTTSQENLERSDELFADLCHEIHNRGMRIILDGVFNHCGSFIAWMDREGIYRRAGRKPAGAFQSPTSPYRPYFHFKDGSTDYEAWWDFPTLPKLNYENSPELCDEIIDIARHWASPPYSIDGWRLDVAADLGHSEDFNHEFWRRFRSELKQVNPDLVIIAEHYGDPSTWLLGDQWDTVMNYDAFMDPLTYFLTGMEKHSDAKNDTLYQDGSAFCDTMRENMARFSWESLLCAMNELSNHDHSRFLTRTNRKIGRIGTLGSIAAGTDVDMRVMREAVAVQMTWPGAPTIYYGDEAGLAGWTDPDCRRTYPWGREDHELIALHRKLTQLRLEHPALRTGSFTLLEGGRGWIAFGRFLGKDCVATICNNADSEQAISLRVRALGISDGCVMAACVNTSVDGSADFSEGSHIVGTVEDGMLSVRVPARTAIVVTPLP